MNWAYIAGFFDGEGCVDINSTSNGRPLIPMAKVSQSGDIGRSVLLSIQGFLAERGVIAIGPYKKATVSPRTGLPAKDSFTLHVCRRGSVETFFRGIVPFLRVKKVLVQDCLRYTSLFPNFRFNSKRGRSIDFCGRGHSLAWRTPPPIGEKWKQCRECDQIRKRKFRGKQLISTEAH